MKHNFLKFLLAGMVLLGTSINLWANDGDFYEVYYYYQKNDGSDVGVQCLSSDNWSKNPIEMREITSTLKITKMYFKVWDDWGDNYNWRWGQLIYSYDNMSNKYYFKVETKGSRTGDDKHNYQFQNENCNLVLARSTDNSGKYTITYCWQGNRQQGGDKYIDDGSGNNYHINYTILPPNVFQYACNVEGFGSGAGTSGDPYKVAKGSKLTITITGSNKHSLDNTDSNSQTQVSWDGGSNWTDLADGSASTQITVNDLTQHNISVWTRNYNSTDKLSSSEVKEETIYYIGTEDPTISLGVSASEIDLGQTITLTPTPGSVSAGGQTYAYQYSTDGGSSYTDIITGQTGANYVWTPSAAGDYKVRIVMTYQTNTYISNVVDVKVYDVYTIKINPKWFANIYLWNSSTKNAEFPGVAVSGEQIGGWYVMQVSSKWEHMIVSDNNSQRNQSAEITIDGSKCYTLTAAGDNHQWGTNEATCPDKPAATTSNPTSIQNTSVTLNGNVSSNNEALTDYGFYWGTTNECTQKEQVGTSDKNSSYTKSLTGLTANTTYYYKAYATNAFGTTYGGVKSFTTKYKVTLTDPAKGGSLSTTGTQYIDASGIQVTATPDIGYSFEKWTNTNCNLENETIEGKKKTVTLVPTADDATLTVSFTEDQWSATVSSGAHGFVSPTGTMDILQVTGKQLTATADAGYYFTGWTVTGSITPSNSTNATETFRATASGGTITANFAERWVLRGSKKGSAEKGGMPADDVAGTMSVNAQGVASINVTLEPNIDYQFKIYDNQSKQERGQKNEATITTTEANPWKLDGTNSVYLATVGYGQYTLSVKESSDRNYPEVSYTAPASYQITMAAKGYTNNAVSSDPSNGGTLTAKTTENATDFVVSDGKYVRSGGEVVFTATPETGYSFAGFYSDAACTSEIQTASVGTTYTTTITDATSVYAKFTENLTTVVIDWDGDGKVQVKDGSGNWTDATKGTTTVQAGVYTHPSVNAVVTDGSSHYFAKWTWNANADFEADDWDEKHAETTVIGKGQGLTSGQTLTANFLELDKIYFNNNAEGVYHWPTENSIHVFFDVKWDNDTKKGVVPIGCQHLTMQQIGSTNIWWTYIPRYVYDHYWGTLAFADADMSSNDYFHGNHAVYRTDYKKEYNMYVPKASTSYNTTDYFSDGYWMRYEGYTPGDNMGYELYKNSSATNIGQFIATSANEGQIKYRIDQTGDIEFCVKTNSVTGYGQATEFTTTTTKQDLPRYNDNYKFTVKVDAEGDYTFTLKLGEGKDMYLEIGYPVGEGDYRVAWTDGSSKKHYSDVVKSNEASEAHTLSMYLKPNEGNLKLQKCASITSGVPQWSEGTAINWTDFTKGQGVYQFDITITADNAALTNVDLYTGNYYIKTDGVKGGWGNYKENIMDENTSTFSKTDPTTYDRYYCQWISNEGKKYNVKCVIANDYCNALSDTLREDNYTEMSGTEPLLPQPANVRFSYNTFTNTLSRAYISGSTDDASKFLVLKNTNNKMYDKTGTNQIQEKKFDDNNNWVYQADIKAQPQCAVKLTAQYNSKTQYFIGSESTDKTIIAGNGTDKYTMRVVYDFKTNLLIAGWVPDGKEITDTIKLGGDMLISRTHQDSAQQIIFGGNVSISDIHHVYGVLTIKKDTMLGVADTRYPEAATNADYSRTMYWVSFPFKVKISEIFGVDGYGTKWIMQKYRGDLRAQKGWFKQDTPTFWEYMDVTDSLNAYEGYLFIIDASYFNTEDADVWKNSATEANFYFPSASGNIGIINKSEYTQKVPAHACGIDREFEVDGVGTVNHKNTDSYWNVIGVPAFQNKSLVLGTETTTEMKAIYEWNSLYNTYTPKALADEFRFQTMHAYMVQFGGDITWSDVSVVNNPTTAPYRYADTKNYFIKLFFGNTEAEDHAYINLADEASTDFVLNEDMMKLDNAGYPNIYSFAGNYNVAYNETKMTNQSVTIGVSAPKDGSYTFSMPKDFSGSAILVDLEEGIYTDLNVSNYSVDLNKGTYNNRFQLMLEVEAKIPTNIQNTNGGLWSEDGKTQKLLINDQIYLINGGRVYNATGTMVR